MPSRRHQSSKPSQPTQPAGGAAAGAAPAAKDPAAMFAAAVKESEARDKVQREKDRQHREAAAQKAADAQAHATSLAQARRDLDRAIAAVRSAKSSGRSTVEADAAWKAAKARVIELETGALPAWAPPPAVEETNEADNDADNDAGAASGEPDDGSPVDGGSVGEEQA